MRYLLFYSLAMVVLLTSCQNETETKESNIDTENEVAERSVCYLRTAGSNHQDSFAIQLYIKGKAVTGDMKYLPWEKDARSGTIEGSIDDNIVTADWHCTQEGMDFTVPISFRIEEGKLLQQQSDYNENGEEYLPKEAPYTIDYTEVDCDLIPTRNY